MKSRISAAISSRMVLEREVTRVEEATSASGMSRLKRLGAGRQEEGVVLAPDRQKARLVRAEVVLEFRIQRDVALVVAEEIELDLVGAGARQIDSCRANSRQGRRRSRRTRRGCIARASSPASGMPQRRAIGLATDPANRPGSGSSLRSGPPHRRCRSAR